MSLQVVALGSECASGAAAEELMSQGQLQGALLWSYLGPGALGAPDTTLHPPFMEYTAQVFGDVSVDVRDCPDWVRARVSVGPSSLTFIIFFTFVSFTIWCYFIRI
uniref:Uncharacterized protein n=1 Tax=Neogobius melanostomus TaxID=47308 RepID=A0A8C6UJP6_9GOBI